MNLDTTELEIPNQDELLNKTQCNKDNNVIKEYHLGYYRSNDHITLLNVQNCSKTELVHNVMKFYDLLFD